MIDKFEQYVIKYGIHSVAIAIVMMLIPSVIAAHEFLYWALDREPYHNWYYIDAGLTASAGLPTLLLLLGLVDKIYKQKLELSDAISKVKELEAILPMCAGCKSIRDTNGCWHAPDYYIRNHTNSQISHGLCELCVAKTLEAVSHQTSG